MNALLELLVPAGCQAKAGTTPEPYTNSGWAKEIVHETTGIELMYIPAGAFVMGSPESEAGRYRQEEVQHPVTISCGFYLGKHAVTQGQWERLMKSNPSHFKGENLPVETVSWNDAQDFCRQAGFRLPTESEWEYACRAGTTGAYSGTGILDSMGWYDDNSGGKTHPVGQKAPNGWGLYDMHGNVWEWCADAEDLSPTDVVTPAKPDSSPRRPFRGGSWFSLASLCRSAYRVRGGAGARGDNQGFRVALSTVQAQAAGPQGGAGGHP